jgi:hypothetical protein
VTGHWGPWVTPDPIFVFGFPEAVYTLHGNVQGSPSGAHTIAAALALGDAQTWDTTDLPTGFGDEYDGRIEYRIRQDPTLLQLDGAQIVCHFDIGAAVAAHTAAGTYVSTGLRQYEADHAVFEPLANQRFAFNDGIVLSSGALAGASDVMLPRVALLDPSWLTHFGDTPPPWVDPTAGDTIVTVPLGGGDLFAANADDQLHDATEFVIAFLPTRPEYVYPGEGETFELASYYSLTSSTALTLQFTAPRYRDWIEDPPPTDVYLPYLRMTQRDDGLGLSPAPRLGGRSRSVTNPGTAPRVGRANRYD